MLGRMNSKTMLGFKADELATAQRKWQAREISNVRVEAICPHNGATHMFNSSRTSAF
jgi:hypothetical protein